MRSICCSNSFLEGKVRGSERREANDPVTEIWHACQRSVRRNHRGLENLTSVVLNSLRSCNRKALRFRPPMICLANAPGSSLGHDADLLEEREIVFEMPVIGDPAVSDTQDIGGDEIDWLAGAGVSHESAGEMSGEAHMRDDAVAHYQPLYDRHFEVRHRGEETLGGLCGPDRPLHAAMRQCVVHEIRPDRAREQRRTAIDPEAVEGIHGLEQSGKALGRDVGRHDLLLRSGHSEREGIADRRGGRGSGEHHEGERCENAHGPYVPRFLQRDVGQIGYSDLHTTLSLDCLPEAAPGDFFISGRERT